MTKRADRRTGGFLPEDERGGARYAARGHDPKWTPAQDAVLVAAVCACRGRPAYLGMAAPLMEALGHPPTYADGCVPHPSKHAETCVRALELRLVTKMLGAYNGWTPHALVGFHKPAYADFPLTWGVKVKILRPYFARLNKTRAGLLSWPSLLRMVGCKSDKAIKDYFARIDGTRDASDDTAPPPVRPQSVEQLAEYVKSLDYCLEVESPTWQYKDKIIRLLGVVP